MFLLEFSVFFIMGWVNHHTLRKIIEASSYDEKRCSNNNNNGNREL